MRPQRNVGWYVPNKREMNGSHCLTIVTFGGTSIVEAKLHDVGAFENDPTSLRMLLSDCFADLLAPLLP